MSSLQSLLRRAVPLALALIIAAPASAEDAAPKEKPASGMGSGCAAFKWPLDRERAAFESTDIEKVASGTDRGAWKAQAFRLTLKPEAEVTYAVKPSSRKKSEAPTFGAMVAFSAPATAGHYQVTLSDGGWIDVVQDNAPLKPSDHSGVKGCPGLRKSVRFELKGAPVVLQISGAPADSINVAISAVE